MNTRKRSPQPLPEPPAGYVAIARILGARGVRGDFRVEPLAPSSILAPGRAVRLAGRDTRIQSLGGTGKVFLKVEGVDDRETAAALRDEYILVREADLDPLPEGEYYRIHLIGLRVLTTDGRDLGRITDIISTRENDVFVVTGAGGENLVPVIEDIIQEIDVAGGKVIIEAVPGLLKD